jgi:hypothetical protein
MQLMALTICRLRGVVASSWFPSKGGNRRGSTRGAASSKVPSGDLVQLRIICFSDKTLYLVSDRYKTPIRFPAEVCPLMSKLKSNPVRRNVHIWSDRERLMRSRSHKIWWRVKSTFDVGFEGTTSEDQSPRSPAPKSTLALTTLHWESSASSPVVYFPRPPSLLCPSHAHPADRCRKRVDGILSPAWTSIPATESYLSPLRSGRPFVFRHRMARPGSHLHYSLETQNVGSHEPLPLSPAPARPGNRPRCRAVWRD